VRAPVLGLEEGERTLDADASRYLVRSLRLREGDTVVLFDPARGREAHATVLRVPQGRGGVVVRVEPLHAATLVAARGVTWIQGIAKGDKMDAIVRDATELGATSLVPVLTAFSVVKLDEERAGSRRSRWERIAREAARQCGRGDAPGVALPAPWRLALAKVPRDAARFCLSPRAEAPLGPLLARALREGVALAFAAGPEGGLSEDEVAEAERDGWSVVSLGGFILRTETVATAVLGAVRVLDVPRDSF
jgi:16S rRNA (uracil1498-N3)-methyltransferase